MITTKQIEKYYRPATVAQALELKESMPSAVFLAGGTQINRAPLERVLPETVIDLQEALDDHIRIDEQSLRIGACISLQNLMDNGEIPEALSTAAAFIPTRNVRNQATLGGNIAANRSDSYLIPVLIALSAEVILAEGRSTVAEYVANDLKDLILEIVIPLPSDVCIAVKESRSHQALPVVSAAVSLKRREDGGIAGACIAAGCISGKVIRLGEVEAALIEGSIKKRADIESAIRDSVKPISDIIGSVEYKKYINAVRIADAVIQCREAF